jgi:hypothetical protein
MTRAIMLRRKNGPPGARTPIACGAEVYHEPRVDARLADPIRACAGYSRTGWKPRLVAGEHHGAMMLFSALIE